MNQHGSSEGSAPRPEPFSAPQRAMIVLAVIVALVFLKYSATVSLPIAFSLFLVALFWPIYRRLARRIPNGVAAVTSMILFIAALSLIGLGLFHSAQTVSKKAPEYKRKAEQTVEDVKSWAKGHDIPLPEGQGSVPNAVESVAKSFAGSAVAGISGLVLVIAFMTLGLLEVVDFKDALLRRMSAARREEVGGATVHIAHDFQRYIVVRTLVGIITGVAVGLGAWAIGLDFPFIWGLANFLLNYIPTLGSIVGVFPPVLFALLSRGDPLFALLTFGVVGGVQILMGNFIDPLLQGRYLKLSPAVVLASVVLWGWVWGIPGAFIGVPMTTGIVIASRRFPRTRWIAALLAPKEALNGADS